jgi:hypothetical protein
LIGQYISCLRPRDYFDRLVRQQMGIIHISVCNLRNRCEEITRTLWHTIDLHYFLKSIFVL